MGNTMISRVQTAKNLIDKLSEKELEYTISIINAIMITDKKSEISDKIDKICNALSEPPIWNTEADMLREMAEFRRARQKV